MIGGRWGGGARWVGIGTTPPAPALVLVAIASVQTGSAIAKRLFEQAGPGGLVLLRLLFAAVVLLALTRPALRRHRPVDLRLAVVFGLVLAAMNLSFYEAADRIPLGVAVTFEFVGPLAVAVGGSRRGLDLLWGLLAAAGVIALSEGGGAQGVGILLALVAGGFWAAYILVSQRVGRVFPGTAGLALACAVGSAAVLPVGVLDGGTALLRPGVLFGGFVVALLSSAVPYSLELAALRRMSAAVFGVLMSLEPAMAALAGLVVLGETLAPRQLLGMALVCMASAGATLATRGSPAAASP
jgi:inner membrane transporter RhtA